VRKLLLVIALLLLFGLGTGLALQPDDGTPVRRPEGVGLKVDGANHAKPLPRVISIADVISTLAVVLPAVLLLMTLRPALGRRRQVLAVTHVSVFLAPVVARRGPPVHA
jgi:hypothetical protein